MKTAASAGTQVVAPRLAAAGYDVVVRLLLVEDHAMLAASTALGLREAGYAVDVCGDGEEALAYTDRSAYDVIILDWMLPKKDGLAVLRRLQQVGSAAQVLMLTARDGVDDRVEGLDAGADDYLIKPFALPELLARVRVLLRRKYSLQQGIVRVADLEFDPNARKARRAGRELSLSAREFALLEYLVHRRGQVVTRAEIVEHVYDLSTNVESNVIDVYISVLRKKLDQDGLPRLIHTHRGLGYSLEERP